jgi:hypothetical protein
MCQLPHGIDAQEVLRPLWEYDLLPSLDTLVAEGGQCEGVIVVHQEDNAGNMISQTLH